MQAQDNNEQSKDVMIFTKSASVGVDSKGREKVDLRFTDEQTKQLIAELTGKTAAKLQIHIGEGQYGPSAFLFVKEVQERSAGGPQKKGAGPSAGTKDKIAALKKQG